MMTDPIADMLTRIRNAARAGHTSVALPSSKLKEAVARVLQSTGYLSRVEVTPGIPATLTLEIRYHGKEPVLLEVTRVSKPGKRTYVGWQEIPRVKNGYGIAVLSTPQGIMSGEEARKKKVGGEFICTVS